MYCMWMYLSIYIYLHVRINIHIVYLYFKKHLHSCCMLLSRFPASFKKTFGWFWRLPLASFGKKNTSFYRKNLETFTKMMVWKKKTPKSPFFETFKAFDNFLLQNPLHVLWVFHGFTKLILSSEALLNQPLVIHFSETLGFWPPGRTWIRGIIKPWDGRFFASWGWGCVRPLPNGLHRCFQK